MSEVLTLEDYAQMAEGEKVELHSKSDYQSPFTPGHAYPVEITGQSFSISRNGYSQMELDISIVRPDGQLSGAGKHWECMPIDMPENLPEEKVIMLRGVFGRNVHNLFRACDNETWSIYAKKVGNRYLDSDGNDLSREDRARKREAIENALLGACKAFRDGKLSLVGKRFFLVKVEHKSGKVYTQFHSEAPEKFPQADASLEAPF